LNIFLDKTLIFKKKREE